MRADRTAPGFLSQVLGIASVDVSATAKARAFNMGSAKYVAPIAVRRSHPLISGPGCPCFEQMTAVELETGNPSLGAFKILNIDGSFGGTGSATLTDWLLNGYDGYMSLGWDYSNPGAKFNPSDFGDAIIARRGSELLFPIYDETRAQGAGYEYRVVGWIGFHVQAFIAQGAGGAVDGYFTRVVWGRSHQRVRRALLRRDCGEARRLGPPQLTRRARARDRSSRARPLVRVRAGVRERR